MFRRKQTPPAASMGIAADPATGSSFVRYACSMTGQPLSEDEARRRGVANVTTSLVAWTGDTHGAFFDDLKIKRHPTPEYHELAERLATIAASEGDLAHTVVGYCPSGLKAFDFIRQHEAGRLHITAAPPDDVQSAVAASAPSAPEGSHTAVEPRMHSIWRAARAAAAQAHAQSTAAEFVVAAVALTSDGYGYAIGTSVCGAPIECTEEAAAGSPAAALAKLNPLAIELADVLAEKITETNFHDNNLSQDCDVFFYATAEAALWPDLVEAFTSSCPDMRPTMLRVPGDEESPLPTPPAEAAAWGSALAGSSASGGFTADLNDPVGARAARIREERRDDEVSRKGGSRRAAALALFLLPVLFIGAAAGRWWSLYSQTASYTAMKEKEEARSAELQRYIAWKANASQQYNYYYDLAKKITEMRRKQPATANLLIDLDQLWPRGDASWYVTGLALPPNNTQIEIRGKTRSREAFGEFTEAMEMRASDKFDNILPTIGDLSSGGAAAAANGAIGIVGGPGRAPDASAKQPAFEWWLKVNYKPLNQNWKPSAAPGAAPATAPASAPAQPPAQNRQLPQQTAAATTTGAK